MALLSFLLSLYSTCQVEHQDQQWILTHTETGNINFSSFLKSGLSSLRWELKCQI